MTPADHTAGANDKEAPILRRFDDAVREQLRRLVSDRLIEEHRHNPAGPHSLELDHLLNYFRRANIVDKYAILAVKPFAAYRLVVLSGIRGVLPRFVDEQVYSTEAEADHAVFVRRVRDLMDPTGGRPTLGEQVSPGDVHVHGYADQISVKAGERILFMLSAFGTERVRTQLLRLVHGDQHPTGPGYLAVPVEAPVNGEWPVTKQYVQKGNFLRVRDPERRLAPEGAFTLHAFIFPTLPGADPQTLLGRGSASARSGYGLGLDADGHLAFWIGDGAVVEVLRLDRPLAPHIWYFVAASFDPKRGIASIRQHALINRYNSRISAIVAGEMDAASSKVLRRRPRHIEGTDVLIGGTSDHDAGGGAIVSECYNGKIDRCGVQGRILSEDELAALRRGARPPAERLLAYWDTSLGYTERGIGDEVIDVGPHALHALGYNRPVRGQTGWNWQGHADCFRLAPDEYGGIEFHADALTDCRWQPNLSLDLPADLKSGAYALKLIASRREKPIERHVVFFVRSAEPRAAICLLVPTASYLAYANGPRSLEADVAQVIMARTPILTEFDIEACANNYEFGLSAYDLHADGAGVCYTSYRRPMYTMEPTYRLPGVAAPWEFPADLSLIAWLDHMGYDYELVTDEDLDREGVAALKPYRIVLNATHCEYYSERMLDATEDYLARGGRLLYLSGNGYYWVVAFRPEEPWIMEIRRREAGSRAWEGRPGEGYLATTGERAGLWRHRNRAPQKLVGTGFSAEGMDISVGYTRLPDSRDPRGAWIFEGVDADSFGDFGLVHGGAVGLEIDRYDRTLGSPPDAFLLATSQLLSSNWQLVQEEVLFSHPGLGGNQHPMARCDMVYFTTRGGGAVFAPSSIAWGSSLLSNKFDNNVSRIMKNVVDMFLKAEPLPGAPQARGPQ